MPSGWNLASKGANFNGEIVLRSFVLSTRRLFFDQTNWKSNETGAMWDTSQSCPTSLIYTISMVVLSSRHMLISFSTKILHFPTSNRWINGFHSDRFASESGNTAQAVSKGRRQSKIQIMFKKYMFIIYCGQYLISEKNNMFFGIGWINKLSNQQYDLSHWLLERDLLSRAVTGEKCGDLGRHHLAFPRNILAPPSTPLDPPKHKQSTSQE